MGDQLKVLSAEPPKGNLTDAVIFQLSNLARIGLIDDLKGNDTFTCVRVRALKDTTTLNKGNEYWGVKQIQYQGWYLDKERDVITLVGDGPWFGPRDYSPKSFEIIETHDLSFEEVRSILDRYRREKTHENSH